MPQFCILFYANNTILATQEGGAWHYAPSLNTPLRTRQAFEASGKVVQTREYPESVACQSH